MTTSKKTEILFVNVLASDDNAVTTTFRRSLHQCARNCLCLIILSDIGMTRTIATVIAWVDSGHYSRHLYAVS
jgi:hypothetical protein